MFVPPLLALGAALAVWPGAGAGGKVVGVLLVGLVPLSVAGFWWGRNLLLTGNPLYPLHLAAFGRVWLAGWYGPEVMRLSQYYIPVGDWRSGVDILLIVLDPRLAPVWLAAVAGAWAVGRPARGPEGRWVWVASALAVLNVALFWAAIPYRTQYRFMYHALGPGGGPAGADARPGPARAVAGRRVARRPPADAGGLAVRRGDAPLGPRPARPQQPGPPISTLPTTLAQFRAVAASAAETRGRRLSRWSSGLAAFATVLAWAPRREKPTAGEAGAGSRWRRRRCWRSRPACCTPGGPTSARRFLRTVSPTSTAAGSHSTTRPGRAGRGSPTRGPTCPISSWASGLRNEVRYVNVDAHRDWLLHDYHRAAGAGRSRPATWPDTRPGWDRLHPDYDAWLANLRAEGIQLLVVTRVNPGQGARHRRRSRTASRSSGSGPTRIPRPSSRSTARPSATPCSGSTASIHDALRPEVKTAVYHRIAHGPLAGPDLPAGCPRRPTNPALRS